MKHILIIIKGLIIGGTMMVPGVSGGSMAMILGIYDKMIAAVSSFFKHKVENAVFLSLAGIGGVLGMFLFSKPLLHLIESYPMPTMYFFMGAVIGSAPMVFRKSKLHHFSIRGVCYVILGIIMVMTIGMIPMGAVAETNAQAGIEGMFFLAVAGIIAAIALVLPGISVSYLLLVLGLYDETMKAISELYLPYLVPLAAGLLLGVVLTTKFLEMLMRDYPQPTYLVILGFVLGSLVEVYPGIPTGTGIALCLVTFSVGFLSIYLLSKKENYPVTES